MRIKRNKIALITVFGLIMMIIATIFFLNLKNKENNDYIMFIDDMKVSKEEISMVVDDVRLKNKNNIINTYNASPEDFDWNKIYGGKKGIQYLLDDLIAQTTRIKVIQQLGVEAKIIEEFDYQTFLKMLKNENNEREKKISNGDIVYGLEKYNQKQYYDYLNNNLLLNLKTYLIENKKIVVTDEEITKVYEENKNYFNNLEFTDVVDSVKNLCYEKNFNAYIEEKMKEVKINYNERQLEVYLKEMLG